MSLDIEINLIPVFEITEVEVTNLTTDVNTTVEVESLGEFTLIQGDVWSASDQYIQNELNDHLADVANPHNTTLEQARDANNQLTGNIDANSNQIDNLTNPSSAQQASTKAYTDAAQAAAESYADGLVVGVFRPVGNHDASTGSYPESGTGSGTSGAIRRGDTYLISVAGTLGGFAYDIGDSIFAQINTPGTSSSNWGDFEHNTQQATESLRGTAAIATATEGADENSTNDIDLITPKKLWTNFWGRVRALAWTWDLKQTFTTAPRFNSASASQYLKTDSSKDLSSVSAIPAADVSGTKTSVFISDFSTAVAALTPVKASSSDLNTGTDDTKFATAAALNASIYVDQNSAKLSATALGTDTYTASLTPNLTTYTAGQTFHIKFTNANTGTSTININSLGAKPIKKNGSTELLAGDIASGQVLVLVYDGTNFQPVGLAQHYGTYSPNLTNTTNIAASTTALATWFRMGNIVTVDGSVQIDPTTTGMIALEIALPIASTFAASTNCNGVANEATTPQVGALRASLAGNATLVANVSNTANKTWCYHFTYLIL